MKKPRHDKKAGPDCGPGQSRTQGPQEQGRAAHGGDGMKMREFLKKHREEIDQTIESQGGPKNDQERELIVRNYEWWYRQARREGVRV